MEILFVTNLITSHLKTKLKIFSTKLVLQYLVSFKEHLVSTFIKNLIFFQKIVHGATLRYLTSYLNTNDNWFTTQEHQIKTISEDLGQELTNSNNRFSIFVSMNGTN